MSMEERISTFHEYHEIVSAYAPLGQGTRYFFRGVSDADFKLIPSLGRLDICDSYYYSEKNIFQMFKCQAVQFIDKVPSNDWEWLALAQHSELPTRLMDWTTNPLIALYFASQFLPTESDDFAVYILTKKTGVIFPDPLISPFDYEGNNILAIPHVSPKMKNQFGYFSIQEKINVPFDTLPNTGRIRKLTFSSSLKEEMQSTLLGYGINEATVYPTIEGLAGYLCQLLKLRK